MKQFNPYELPGAEGPAKKKFREESEAESEAVQRRLELARKFQRLRALRKKQGVLDKERGKIWQERQEMEAKLEAEYGPDFEKELGVQFEEAEEPGEKE